MIWLVAVDYVCTTCPLRDMMKATGPSSYLKSILTYSIICNFRAFLEHPDEFLGPPLFNYPRFQQLISQVSEQRRNLSTHITWWVSWSFLTPHLGVSPLPHISTGVPICCGLKIQWTIGAWGSIIIININISLLHFIDHEGKYVPSPPFLFSLYLQLPSRILYLSNFFWKAPLSYY